MKRRYYSPQLDRDLVSALYHTAKARGIPMTKLANRLLRAALRDEGVERAAEAGKSFGVGCGSAKPRHPCG